MCRKSERGRMLYWKKHQYGLEEPVMKEGVKKGGGMMSGAKNRKEEREKECREYVMDERRARRKEMMSER
jgi:hypothetical protein